jgi:hypothetical protein
MGIERRAGSRRALVAMLALKGALVARVFSIGVAMAAAYSEDTCPNAGGLDQNIYGVSFGP